MIPKLLSDIVEADIQALRDGGVQEGQTLEFKRELPGTRDEDKREFLADASSFANTDGGDIIYGVAEEQGVITDIVGASSPDFDAEILRLESLIRDGISPRMGITSRIVPCAAGKLLVLRIEKSWIRPHRVIFRGHDKFYGRTSAGKFALDVSQLRTAFLHSATLSEQISTFRVDRIIDIANDRAPVALVKAPTVVLHLVPLNALSEQPEFDVAELYRNPSLHQPLSASGWSQRMTFDGILLHTPVDGEGKVSSYTQFYRNGILEAVATSLLETRQVPGQRLIPHVVFESSALIYLQRCLQSLERLGVRPPVSVMLTILNVRGLRMAMGAFSDDGGNEIREETLILPGALAPNFSASPSSILRPMFDRMWNACGLLRSSNFDEAGNWAHRCGF
ncbi:MAG TPA: ATP-binding protein [Bryobacteraceae bacterium]|nr:ATP-binding protein [Bryobacteraceae bacterium]